MSLRLKVIRLFLLVTLSGFLFGRSADVTSQTELKPMEKTMRSSAVYQKNMDLTFIQPFNLFFRHNDFHVMLYFKEHPEYEAVEAMIEKRKEKEPLVWAIITRHDQTQIDHINNQELVEEMQASSSTGREIHYTPIQFYSSDETGKPHILLKFTSFKGENIVFDFYAAAKPLSKHGGLTDPERHGEISSLPIMWREKSTLASPKSKISFDGKNYKIPVEVSIPIFFKGMKGYYTEGFRIGGMTIGETDLKLVKKPERIEIGMEWIYKTNNDKWIYKIVEINDDQVIIQKVPETSETISARIANDHLEIAEIKVTSPSGREGAFIIKFDPCLPDMVGVTEGQKLVSRFSISVDDRKALVTGKIELKKETDRIVLNLDPEQPDWAVKRAMLITVSGEDNRYWVKTVVKDTQ